MSALHYQSVFEETITQTTDIKLAGETNAGPVTATDTITLSVSVEQLNAALTWTGNYVNGDRTLGRAEAFPEVTFSLKSLMDLHASVSADFSDVTKDKLSGANSDVDTLQGKFKKITENFTGISTWTPANIPLEAVVKVVNNEFTGNTLAQTLVSPAASSTVGSYPVNLYEQAVAADKTKNGGADFVAGDSISVYIRYNLEKTRAYTLDALQGIGASATIAGMPVATGSESATQEKIYEVKFVAAGSP
jgi:hypothetical protein